MNVVPSAAAPTRIMVAPEAKLSSNESHSPQMVIYKELVAQKFKHERSQVRIAIDVLKLDVERLILKDYSRGKEPAISVYDIGTSSGDTGSGGLCRTTLFFYW